MNEIHEASLYEALSGCCLELRLACKEERRLDASADFRFPPDFAGFQGHFPGNPILPAIVQLTAVRFVAERAVGHGLAPALCQKIKFKGIIRPGNPVTVNLAMKKAGGKWGGNFSLKRPDGEVVASGLVEFGG